MKFVKLLTVIVTVCVVEILCDCLDVSPFVVKNIGLDASQFWVSGAQDIKQCAQMCVRRKPCRSITFDFQNQTCELNSGTKENTLTRYGESIVYSEFDWWLKDMDEHCYSRPCKVNEVCIPGKKLIQAGSTDRCQYTCMLAGREVCPMPVGGVTAGRSVGDINVFHCSHGFTGSDSAECLPNLQWSKTINKVCEEIYEHTCSDNTMCDPILAICVNGRCNCNTDMEYDPIKRTCITAVPVCGNPPEKIGASIDGNEDDTTRTYICDPPLLPHQGLDIEGTVTCTNGVWSTSTYECFGVRLVPDETVAENPGMHVGYLEIFTSAAGGWTNVCSDGWNWKATFVTCGQLGFNFGGSFHTEWYGKVNPTPVTALNENSFKFKDISCEGDESGIELCTYQRDVCSDRSKDLVLSCFGEEYAAGTHVSLRGNVFDGLVIGDYGSLRGALCGDGWTSAVTDVTCRTIDQHWSRSDETFLDVIHPAISSQFHCDGSEPHLFFCRNQGWGYYNNCNKVVYITCIDDEAVTQDRIDTALPLVAK